MCGRDPVVPEGYGAVRIPANNSEGYVPIKCCYTPDIPNFILSPNSFKPLLGKHYNGYTLECDDDKKMFQHTVNHKKRKSGSLLLFGTTRGGLCYTRSAVPPMPITEGTAEMSLDAADKAAISMIEDHPKNSYQDELKLHALSAKAERLLWHQRLAHCGDEQLCQAHMFSDGVPEMRLAKDSALDSCPVCLAANMKSRNRGDGETHAATEPGQGLSIDFSFAGQHSKNATNPEQMPVNDYMGIHGETCCLLVYDHATERLDGVCRQSKAPPLAWLKKWLTKNVKDDVKDRYLFMDQGGELYRSKAIRDLFEKECGYEIRVTGTGAHHQNGLVECANQTMHKAIRVMLIGAGLPVKFWPYAF